MLNTVKTICQEHHDAKELAMRYGAVTAEGKQTNKYSSGCYGSITGYFVNDKKTHPFVYVPYHGDGCALSMEALCDLKTYNKEMAAYPRDWNKFEGNERSMIWTEFLLGDHSPWAALLPFLAEKDKEYCNTAGFIFQDLKKSPNKLFYNFLMAVRFPWELAKTYAHWLLLREKMDDRLALYIANNFELRQSVDKVKGATGLEEGPWDIIYPWSYLESTTLEAAGRFVRCKPGTLSDSESLSNPNVAALWTTKGKPQDNAWKLAEELSKNEKLTLTEIVVAVETCIAEQEAAWEAPKDNIKL